MCKSADQSDVEYTNDSKRQDSFSSETDLHFICATTTDAHDIVEGDSCGDKHVLHMCVLCKSSSVNHTKCRENLAAVYDLSEKRSTNSADCIVGEFALLVENEMRDGFSSETDLHFMCATTTDAHENVEAVQNLPERCSTNSAGCIVGDFAFLVENGIRGTLPISEQMISNNACAGTKMDATQGVNPKIEDPNIKKQGVTGVFIVSRAISDVIPGKTPAKFAEVLTSIAESDGQECTKKASEQATKDVHGDAKVMTRATLQHFNKKTDCSSALKSFGVSTYLSTEHCTELKHENVTLNNDAVLQDPNNSYENSSKISPEGLIAWIAERPSMIDKLADQYNTTTHSMATNGSMKSSIACEGNDHKIATGTAINPLISAEQIESKGMVSRQTVKGMLAIEMKEISTPAVGTSMEKSAKEHVLKSSNEAHQNSPATVNLQGSNVTSTGFQTVQASSKKASDGSEIAEFFSSARDPKCNAEIEEQNDLPTTIQCPMKQKLVKESPRSLRMLLFAEETAFLAKKDEEIKSNGGGTEFSNKIVPASDPVKDIKLSVAHKVIDDREASSSFDLTFSGALLCQGMLSEPGAYSGSISHGSDSSTSMRSFAFPILASEWNSSPVKMGAPDSCFIRQKSKRHFSFCCCRPPSTVFD